MRCLKSQLMFSVHVLPFLFLPNKAFATKKACRLNLLTSDFLCHVNHENTFIIEYRHELSESFVLKYKPTLYGISSQSVFFLEYFMSSKWAEPTRIFLTCVILEWNARAISLTDTYCVLDYEFFIGYWFWAWLSIPGQGRLFNVVLLPACSNHLSLFS